MTIIFLLILLILAVGNIIFQSSNRRRFVWSMTVSISSQTYGDSGEHTWFLANSIVKNPPKFKFMVLKTPTISMFYFRCTLDWYTLMIHITFKTCVNICIYTQMSSGLVRKLWQKLWWNAHIPTAQLFVMNTLQLTSQNMPVVHTDYTRPHQMHHWISSAFPQASCCNTFWTLISHPNFVYKAQH